MTEAQRPVSESDGAGASSDGTPVSSDGTLVSGVLAGERDRFAVLYDRYARLVRAICLAGARDFHAAADLTQEVFLRAYRNLGRLEDGEQFGPWLTGIARRACSEWRRGHQRDRRRIAEAQRERSCGDGRDPSPARAEAEETRERLLRHVAELPERERLATHAFYLLGMNAAEAGRVTGLSRSSLYRVLSSARLQLRRALSQDESWGDAGASREGKAFGNGRMSSHDEASANDEVVP